MHFADEMHKRLGLPVEMENDASCAAYAEFKLGAGRGTTDMFALTLGTGVGGGVVSGGKLFRAYTELGHMVIVEDGEPCQGACSGRGHVEAYCSGTAAGKIAKRVLGPDATARDLVEQQHPALGEIGHHLGVAIGSLVNIFGSTRVDHRRRLRDRRVRSARSHCAPRCAARERWRPAASRSRSCVPSSAARPG